MTILFFTIIALQLILGFVMWAILNIGIRKVEPLVPLSRFNPEILAARKSFETPPQPAGAATGERAANFHTREPRTGRVATRPALSFETP